MLFARALRVLPVVFPLALFVWTGLLGIDFGFHWDTPDHIAIISKTTETKTLLPIGKPLWITDPELSGGYYGYPSITYWLHLAGLVPEIIKAGGDISSTRVKEFVNSQAYVLRMRRIFLAVSSLAILWVYLTLLCWRGDWRQALLGAFLLAGSWEFAYHARWVATDALVLQFSALCLLMCVLALTDPAHRILFLRLGAAAAGLGVGAKYPAGALLLLVLTAAILTHSRTPWRMARLAMGLTAIMLATFLLTTPGALLQPWFFMAWLKFNQKHYAVSGHFGYDVPNQATHVKLILEYLSQSFFSAYRPVAIAVSAFVVAGMVVLLRDAKRFAILLMVLPALYIAYLSSNRVMIVRNLLIVTPYLAVFAAVGAWFLLERVPRIARYGLAAALTAIVGVNIAWLFASAKSIDEAKLPAWQIEQARRFVAEHANDRFYSSLEIRRRMRMSQEEARELTSEGRTGRSLVLTFAREGDEFLQWPANDPDLTEKVIGPYEVNFNYYPTWSGHNRIVILRADRARGITVPYIQAALRQDPDPQTPAPARHGGGPYLNCGEAAESCADGVCIRDLAGRPHLFPVQAGITEQSYWSVTFHQDALVFQVTGLQPGKAYRLGYIWWDVSGDGRIQSLAAISKDGGPEITLVPPSRLPPGGEGIGPTPLAVLLPTHSYAGGEVKILIRRHGASNVVMSDIYVEEVR